MYIEERKKYLIDKYLIPMIGDHVGDELQQKIYNCVRLVSAIRFQLVEMPGPSDEGSLWLPVDSVCHAYTYNSLTGKKIGTMIYRKQCAIIDEDCLLKGERRTDYLEILEPGELLQISYGTLRTLLEDHPEVWAFVNTLCREKGTAYHRRARLLQEEPWERVGILKEEYPYFVRCSSQDRQAMHVGMSLTTYKQWLKKVYAGK